MKKFAFVIGITLTIMTLAIGTVYAAPKNGRGKPGSGDGGGGSSSASTLGIDISYPQCGRRLPKDFAFAIIGVNGGLATTDNECFIEQLNWAQQANGSTSQPKVQLYVNTGNPWDDIEAYKVTTWPQNNIDGYGNDSFNNPDDRFNNPYDACVVTPENYIGNTNSEACSWQYGWNRAIDTVQKWFLPKVQATTLESDPQKYKWWLDVETTNSWQALDSDAHLNNKATLEGMVAYLQGVAGVEVGVYSTNYQWGVIVGDTVTDASNLHGLDSWLAGARNADNATSRCTTQNGLTAGSEISMIQFVSKNLDYNVSCL